jgi:hypothetical protein
MVNESKQIYFSLKNSLGLNNAQKLSLKLGSTLFMALSLIIYPTPEISDFQRTNSEFAKSEQKYPVKITLEYA